MRWHLWPPHQLPDADAGLDVPSGMTSAGGCQREDDEVGFASGRDAETAKPFDEAVDAESHGYATSAWWRIETNRAPGWMWTSSLSP